MESCQFTTSLKACVNGEQSRQLAVCLGVQPITTHRLCSALRRFLPALVLLFLMPLLAVAAPTFTASLDRDTISLGETVTLSLTYEDGHPRNQPTAPALPDLEYGSTGRSESLTIVNGQP